MKEKGDASAKPSIPQVTESNKDGEDPESHSEMTLINFDPKDRVTPAPFTVECNVLQLPVNGLWRVLIQYIIQSVIDERAKQEQYILSMSICCWFYIGDGHCHI
jgi:hypothetical protein